VIRHKKSARSAGFVFRHTSKSCSRCRPFLIFDNTRLSTSIVS
jgi:hypothetical protein